MKRPGDLAGKTGAAAACAAALCVDSFLIDPFLLLGLGVIYTALIRRGRLQLDPRRTELALGAGTVILFWVVSISLYMELEWIRWMWELCGAEAGRDWMLNSGVFHFEYTNPSGAVHVLSVLLFAIYPLWMALGFKLGRRLIPEKPEGK